MITASVVTASYLEVASVQESLVQRYTTIDGHFLGGSAPHVVVGAGNAHAIVVLGEKDGAACHARAACSGGAVVVPSVEPGAVHHIADELTRRHPIACSPPRGKRAPRFASGTPHCALTLLRRAVAAPQANPPYTVGGLVQSPYKPSGAFAAVIVSERIVAGGTLPRERAGSRAAQGVALVGAAW